MHKILSIENTQPVSHKITWIALEAHKRPEWRLMEKYADLIDPRVVMEVMGEPMQLSQRVGRITVNLNLNNISDFNMTEYMHIVGDTSSLVAINLSIRELEKIVRYTVAGFFMKVIAKAVL